MIKTKNLTNARCLVTAGINGNNGLYQSIKRIFEEEKKAGNIDYLILAGDTIHRKATPTRINLPSNPCFRKILKLFAGYDWAKEKRQREKLEKGENWKDTSEVTLPNIELDIEIIHQERRKANAFILVPEKDSSCQILDDIIATNDILVLQGEAEQTELKTKNQWMDLPIPPQRLEIVKHTIQYHTEQKTKSAEQPYKTLGQLLKEEIAKDILDHYTLPITNDKQEIVKAIVAQAQSVMTEDYLKQKVEEARNTLHLYQQLLKNTPHQIVTENGITISGQKISVQNDGKIHIYGGDELPPAKRKMAIIETNTTYASTEDIQMKYTVPLL